MVEMVEFSTSSSRCVCVGLLLDACPNRICLVPLVIFMSQKQVRERNRFLTIYYMWSVLQEEQLCKMYSIFIFFQTVHLLWSLVDPKSTLTNMNDVICE